LASAQATVAQSAATTQEKQVSLGRLQTVWKLSGGQVPSRAEMDIGLADLARARAATSTARAGVQDAQAALSSNQINLSKASIRAPADGVVLTRTVEPGSAVAASFQAVTLMTLASDLSQLRTWIYVDEADVGTVKTGQSATFTVSAFLNRQFPATVTRVGSGSTITDNVVTYLTYLDVENKDLLLRPGMTATATIVATQRKNVLLVPNTALRFVPSDTSGAAAKKPTSGLLSSLTPRASTSRTSQAGAQTMKTASAKTVYVLKNGKPEAVPITPGISDGQMTEIVSGPLAAGMLVITNQQAAKAK
jgi:HlyD family secretion protein